MARLKSVRNRENDRWDHPNDFRQTALYYMKNGYYCPHPWGSDKWFQFWNEERNRCLNGLKCGNAQITGEHYFYLNFCPIRKVADSSDGKAIKVVDFPDFWDGDYEYFWNRYIARNGMDESFYKKLKLKSEIKPEHLNGGYNFILAKSRRKGYSFKAGSIGAYNFFFRPDSITGYGAEDTKFLYPKGVFTMVKSYIDFNNDHCAWRTPSDVVNTTTHIRNSYVIFQNGVKIEKGMMSEVMALSFNNNPDAFRGKDLYDLFIEEAGAFGSPGLLQKCYASSEDCVQAGSIKTGMITVWGCVCAGTKVWTNDGRYVNIEDISKETGILGYAGNGTITEEITWLQPPAKKECVRIISTKGLKLECSTDHPVLVSSKNLKGKCTFKHAGDLTTDDYLLELEQIPIFGNKRMWQPRLVGMLIGDGYYGTYYATSQLALSSSDLLRYIDEQGLDYKVRDSKSSDSPYFRYICLHHTQEQLRLLGIQGQSKYAKRLPTNIHEFDKYSVCELLGGLFDTDGYVSKSRGKNKRRITLTSVVLPLLEEVQLVLLRLGIDSNIFIREPKKDSVLVSNVTGKTSVIKANKSYSLEITDLRSVRNFKKHIRLLVKQKRDRLNAYDLSKKNNEGRSSFEYYHTIEDGSYFKAKKTVDGLRKKPVLKVEHIGEQPIYNLSTKYTHTYITNGIVSHNTSGSMDSGTIDYADMFMRPGAFGMLPFRNTWDKDSYESECGFFHPVNMNMEGFYDKNGNSDLEGAKQYELDQREKLIKKGATNIQISNRLQEKPLSPGEAFGTASSNQFPVLELNEQLRKVRSLNLQNIKGVPCDLIYEGSDVIAKPILHDANPITSYTNIPEDTRGCVVIYEQPVGNTPKGLYKIGYDPVRQNQGTSLAAIIVYKSTHAIMSTKEVIVAEYVGRREDNDDMDRIAEMLAIYYNTTVMHENEVTSVKNYFRQRHLLHLLATQPDAVISSNIKKSKVSRIYGCHMTDKLKDAGERYIKDWLLKVIDHDEDGNPIRAYEQIYSIRLLEELIHYSRKGNFDLISALIMCMFQVQEETLGKVYGEEKNEQDGRGKKILEMIKSMNRR